MGSFTNLLTLSSLLISPILAQQALELDPDQYENLKALPAWGHDGAWAERSETDMAYLEPASSEMFLWGGQRRMCFIPLFAVSRLSR
jgi:hypothetical protein